MSEIGKKIRAIVDAGLAPRLKEQGFHRRGINFHRTDGDAIQVVTVQSSQHNFGDSGRFRVNFGVHFPEVARVLQGSDGMPKVPSEQFCLLRALWSFPDRWWAVDSATIASNVVLNLNTYWSEIIWPWLEVNKQLPEAAKTLESQPMSRVTAAAVRLTLGQRDEATRLVGTCIASLENAIQAQSAYPDNVELLTAQLKNVRDWAANHHLL
ncbi:MAG TPA: DUF4304 domain-containing protein [Candidatus Binatus sp.]|jgi:hypothetical protein|nr:DUF4304 domain-containing protein [Candidatus Binatus sp.]